MTFPLMLLAGCGVIVAWAVVVVLILRKPE